MDIVAGTSHTWSVAAISEIVYVVVEEAAIFLSVATGSVEGEGGVVSIVKSSNEDNIIQGYYNLKHLVLFTKCTNLCNSIEMYMKNNFPIVIKFTVGSLGCLKLALAPKIEME